MFVTDVKVTPRRQRDPRGWGGGGGGPWQRSTFQLEARRNTAAPDRLSCSLQLWAPNYSGSIRPENTAFRKKDRDEAQINTRANEDEEDKLTSTLHVWCTDAGPTHPLTVRGIAQHTEHTCNHGDRKSLPPNPTVKKRKAKKKNQWAGINFTVKPWKHLNTRVEKGRKLSWNSSRVACFYANTDTRVDL